MTDQEYFQQSCDKAPTFPKNLVHSTLYYHTLDKYVQKLNEHEIRLFCTEERADVELWEYKDGSPGTQSSGQLDPYCRYMFVHARHSRDPLKVTRKMLVFAFTYHQVMAVFVDFLFPFGKQDYPRDFYFIGLRQEIRFSPEKKGLELPELGRSGRDFRICYNLKSVETSPGQPHWSSSIRQAAIYHSFDVCTGRAFWTIIKGDELLKRRLKKESNSTRYESSISQAFSISLDSYLLIIDRCSENWRWYMSYLEEQEKRARPALLISFDRPTNQTPTPSPQATTAPPHGRFKLTIGRIKQRAASATGRISTPAIPLPTLSPPAPRPEFEPYVDEHGTFSFNDLQQVQGYQGKIGELLLVVRSNMKILNNIKQYYAGLFNSPGFPTEIKDQCIEQMENFQNTIENTITDLEMQESRAKLLLSTVGNGKSLMNWALEYRSMVASKLLAEKAQASTTNMESMMEEMNALAQKTKQETVSMRIITLVTLFFLPGTFISTIMSTDIVQYSQDPVSGTSKKDFSAAALQLYLGVTLPMMAVTFAAWYCMSWWVDKKERAKAMKNNNARTSGV